MNMCCHTNGWREAIAEQTQTVSLRRFLQTMMMRRSDKSAVSTSKNLRAPRACNSAAAPTSPQRGESSEDGIVYRKSASFIGGLMRGCGIETRIVSPLIGNGLGKQTPLMKLGRASGLTRRRPWASLRTAGKRENSGCVARMHRHSGKRSPRSCRPLTPGPITRRQKPNVLETATSASEEPALERTKTNSSAGASDLEVCFFNNSG
mmetsp:Transcript_6753/g.12511  ORF Transcript_6753/g.12511 Transcript_6753/m.12511 type:complete len:206 (+) Transcript_6753:2775-3392(+)